MIQRATAKDLSERYQNIQDLARDFRRAVMGEAALCSWTRRWADAANIENPYKGLRAFEEADASDFFGREALIQHLLPSCSSGAVCALPGGGRAKWKRKVEPGQSGSAARAASGRDPRLGHLVHDDHAARRAAPPAA